MSRVRRSRRWLALAVLLLFVPGVAAQVLPGSPFGGGSGGGGVSLASVNSWTAQQNFADGSVTEPSIGFTSDDDTSGTGFYRANTNQIGITANGAGIVRVYSSGAAVIGTQAFRFLSGAITTAEDTSMCRHAAGIWKLGDGDCTSIRSLQGGGAAVASATAMPVPTGRVFHVTGTTDITSITSTNFEAGVCITLIFDDVLTFTDGNNLVLAGNLTTTAADTISLCYDGSNWYETGRSVN